MYLPDYFAKESNKFGVSVETNTDLQSLEQRGSHTTESANVCCTLAGRCGGRRRGGCMLTTCAIFHTELNFFFFFTRWRKHSEDRENKLAAVVTGYAITHRPHQVATCKRPAARHTLHSSKCERGTCVRSSINSSNSSTRWVCSFLT